MAEPFLAEIRIMGFDFAPSGWAACDGQLLPIDQNPALYQLLGTTFGGDGESTFALPDARGRTPIHADEHHDIGERGGEREHTLSSAETPAHAHAVAASSAATGGTSTPVGRFLGGASDMYHEPASPTPLSAATVEAAGGSQAHGNMQPFLALGFYIALDGVFPSQDQA